MRVSVLLVTWNGEPVVGESLASLAASESVPDVLVVDNASRDDTVEVVRRGFERLEERGAAADLVVNQRNLGFVEGVNLGLRRLLDSDEAEVAVVLNQDAGLAPEFVGEMASLFASDSEAGAAGGKIYYPDSRRLQYAGGEIERPRMTARHRGHHEEDEGAWDEPGATGFVTGAAMALRLEAVREVGLLDPVFSPGYYEDVELCDRLREAGRGVLYQPTAVAWHHESTAFGDPWHRWSLAERNRLIYAMRWLGDPGFLEELRAAELAHLEEASVEERVYLAAAYARTLMAFGPATASRSPHMDRQRRLALIDLLSELRAVSLAAS